MTFREDKNRASSKVEETTQTDAPSSQSKPRRPPPGNTDPTLGPVDWDEVEMQDFQAMLDEREEKRLAQK